MGYAGDGYILASRGAFDDRCQRQKLRELTDIERSGPGRYRSRRRSN